MGYESLCSTALKKIVIGSLSEMSADPVATREHLSGQGLLSTLEMDTETAPSLHLFSQLLDNDGAYRSVPLGNPSTALAVLQYTGGTMGKPKGGMISHKNLSTSCAQHRRHSIDTGVLKEGEERFLVVLPLFHIYALTVNLLMGIKIGAELILHTRFNLDAVIDDIASKKITLFTGVPAMFNALVNYANIANVDLSSLKTCSSGGAQLPVEAGEVFRALTGLRLTEGWGMTETTAVGSFTPVNNIHKPRSCGVPSVGTIMKFASVDDPTRYLNFRISF